MTFKAKILSPYHKAVSWLKNTRIRRLELDVLKIMKVVVELSNKVAITNDLILNEEKLRKDQVSSLKTNIKKELTKAIKEYKETQEDSFIVGLELKSDDVINRLTETINKRMDDITDLTTACHKVIGELNTAENDFLEIKMLGDKAKNEYEKYRDKLIKDVLGFKETDQASRRLASIEERCTILELKLK